MSKTRYWLTMAWGIGGLTALLGTAVVRLSDPASSALHMSLHAGHWVLLVTNVAFMAYSEGWRGFHLSFAPRFADRLADLARNGGRLSWLAPLVAMGYIGCGRRRALVTLALSIAIVALVIAFRFIPQPWRGLLDAGVVVGLGIGLISTWWHLGRRLNGSESVSDAPRSWESGY